MIPYGYDIHQVSWGKKPSQKFSPAWPLTSGTLSLCTLPYNLFVVILKIW